MAENKYDKYFVSNLKSNIPATEWHPKVEEASKGQSGRIVFMDNEVVPGACYAEAVWIRNASSEVQRRGGIQAHTHDSDEVLGFFGTDMNEPYKLGAEIELWLGEEKHIINRTSLVFVPRGLKHCPLRVLKVDKPVLHFSSHSGRMYTDGSQIQQNSGTPSSNPKQTSQDGTEYGKYIVTELRKNIKEAPWSNPSMRPVAPGQSGRILWLDGETVPGAFYVETVWIFPRKDNSARGTLAHTHDYDEVLAFFGSDPDNPHELGGEAEFYIDGEKHVITQSSLVFVPRGLKHSPLTFNRVDRPIFHFSLGHGKSYF